MENLLPLIIQLVSGAVGGNVAGGLMKQLSLGTLGNSIAGIVGGGIGGQLLGLLGVATGNGGMDIGSIVGSLASGGVGGGILMAIIGLIKKAMNK
ncbi:MAG: GlsB/YeaQ/YmgE family stress response membrane protein [Sedimentisphaerales bacterium]|nr:GlsB/YeaQ/YmgE family stress response membrane protein [Sedimentisphaerales bacterium]